VDTLLDGGVVAYPTDTLCGLGCDATNPRAVERLCSAKGRDPREPLPVIVNSRKVLRHLVEDLTPEAEAVLNRFWPGALTVVFRRRGAVLSAIPPPQTLGVRIPDSPVALALARGLARPLVATSANPHGVEPLGDAAEIARAFAGRIDLILDGRPIQPARASTVLDLSGDAPRILRPGAISTDLLARYLPGLVREESK
jgi:L-threonylcarbamoyladenylate synthase